MKEKRSLLQRVLSRLRWFTLGLGLKRWLVVVAIGSALVGLGAVYLILLLQRAGWVPSWLYRSLTLQFLPVWWRVLVTLGLGGGILLLAIIRLGSNLVAPFRRPDEDVVDSLYRHSRQKRGPHIVAIGGGTGLPSLLRGIAQHTSNITAIITVADDGGSSGRLRRELGMLPPGDFRNNMAALARDEALMTQLLQYRFGSQITSDGEEQEPGSLQGHAFGNLLLAALTGITGSFDEALLAAERVLAMQGRVLPSTLSDVILTADILTPDNTLIHVEGESAIPEVHGRIQRVYLEPVAAAYPPALRAIFQADLIVIGPGSLFTSILPNLLVADLAQALVLSKAPKVYVCNLAAQPGETDHFTVADHVNVILNHVPAGCIDIVLANDNLTVPSETGGGRTVFVQPTPLEPPLRLITADLVDEKRPWRHDSEKLAQMILKLLREGQLS